MAVVADREFERSDEKEAKTFASPRHPCEGEKIRDQRKKKKKR